VIGCTGDFVAGLDSSSEKSSTVIPGMAWSVGSKRTVELPDLCLRID